MTKEQFAKAMSYLGILYNKEFDSTQVSIWYEYFHEIDEITFKKAIKKMAVTNKYIPTIAEMISVCKDIDERKKIEILDLMYKDGYFKYGVVGELDEDHEMRNYDKAIMFVSAGIIPGWLLEDMQKYGYKVPLVYKEMKILSTSHRYLTE